MVSVIIPSHPGAPVERCVESVKRSTYKDIEIIVVDEGLERSRQRNIGIDRAKGEYLLFLDSDMTISYYLIEHCVAICENPCRWTSELAFIYYDANENDAIYIPELIMTSGWFGKLRQWERKFYNGTAIDCVRFIRANCCPRFDETMSGPEDSDWDRRIKGKKGIAGHCSYHYDDIGIIDYFKKKAYYSKSMARFKEKWPNDKILNFKWRCWTVFVEDGKWKSLLKRPHYAIAMFVMIFLRGIIYLCAKKS